MQKSREVIDSIVKEKTGILFYVIQFFLLTFKKWPASNGTMSVIVLFCFFVLVVYGITTGFGKFARTVIPVSKLE